MLKTIFLWLWQFPQNLLGLFLVTWLPINTITIYKTSKVYKVNIPTFGISLGKHIILDEGYDKQLIEHEYGHCIQSIFFGPLYLLIIGLPSLMMNILSRLSIRFGTGKFNNNYYKRWPETWADKLGGIKRD
jgi:hypothetical protein